MEEEALLLILRLWQVFIFCQYGDDDDFDDDDEEEASLLILRP